jgi:hypothetical protein
VETLRKDYRIIIQGKTEVKNEKIEVVAAIIYFDNEILCVQRPKKQNYTTYQKSLSFQR